MDNLYIPKIIPSEDINLFKKRLGVRTGFGKKKAIIIIDVVRAFVDKKSPLANRKNVMPVVKNIKELLKMARPLDIPIVYTKPSVSKTKAGSFNPWRPSIFEMNKIHTEILDLISPSANDEIVEKTKPSVFFGTPLLSILHFHDVDTLIITGVLTSTCVRASVVDGFSNNFKVIVPIECVADRSEFLHQVTLFDLSVKYADVIPLKDVLKHLSSMEKG